MGLVRTLESGRRRKKPVLVIFRPVPVLTFAVIEIVMTIIKGAPQFAVSL